MVKVKSYNRKDGTKVKTYTRNQRVTNKKPPFKLKYGQEEYIIEKSKRKNKQLKSTNTKTGKTIHFGDPTMREYPETKREDNYCARSYGITNKKGKPTRNNPESANYWSRRITWDCKGKKGKNG